MKAPGVVGAMGEELGIVERKGRGRARWGRGPREESEAESQRD